MVLLAMRAGLAAVLLAACFAKPPRPGVDAPPAIIGHVKSFMHDGTVANDFTISALNAGDAVVLAVTCISGEPIQMFDLTAQGWTFSELGPLTDPAQSSDSFGALAPDTATVLLHVSSTPSCNQIQTMGDEFTNVDPIGGGVTFDSSRSTYGTDTSITLPTGHANDAVWAAMTDSGTALPGGKFTAGASLMGNLTEYLITTDPAGTFETAAFDTGATVNVITAVTIKPR